MCACFNLNISLSQEKEEKRLGRIEAAFRKFDLDGDGYLRWKDGKMGSSFKYVYEKYVLHKTNFVNSIFDWSQTFSFPALILMKYETSWKSM